MYLLGFEIKNLGDSWCNFVDGLGSNKGIKYIEGHSFLWLGSKRKFIAKLLQKRGSRWVSRFLKEEWSWSSIQIRIYLYELITLGFPDYDLYLYYMYRGSSFLDLRLRKQYGLNAKQRKEYHFCLEKLNNNLQWR